MTTVQAQDGQTIFDLSLQLYGSVEGLFDVLALNELDVNTDIAAGALLIADAARVVNARMVERLRATPPCTYELVEAVAGITGLTALAAPRRVNLTWDNAEEEDGYYVYQSSTAGGPYALIATLAVDVTTYEVTGLADGTDYFFRVSAFNDVGESAFAQVGVTTPFLIASVSTTKNGLFEAIVTKTGDAAWWSVGGVESNANSVSIALMGATVPVLLWVVNPVNVSEVDFTDCELVSLAPLIATLQAGTWANPVYYIAVGDNAKLSSADQADMVALAALGRYLVAFIDTLTPNITDFV